MNGNESVAYNLDTEEPGAEELRAGFTALRDRLRQPAGEFVRAKEFLIEKALLVCGMVSILAIALIFVFLFKEGLVALQNASVTDFIYNTSIQYEYDPVADETVAVGESTAYNWQPVGEEPKLSILPLLWGSLSIAFLAAVFSTLIGVAIGIYLSEIARPKIRETVKPALELLVGIPTVVVGFFMLAVIALPLKSFTNWLGLGTIYVDSYNAFIGALGVSLVIIPVIASLVDDALKAVPADLRAASLALGSTRWQMIRRVVLPAGVSGVFAAVVLGFGRALGETMIVLMCAGNAPQMEWNPFLSVRTMTSTIAAEMGAAQQDGIHVQALFLVGALLVTITFTLNVIVEVIVNHYRKKIRL